MRRVITVESLSAQIERNAGRCEFSSAVGEHAADDRSPSIFNLATLAKSMAPNL
jgi:hypothetical protein